MKILKTKLLNDTEISKLYSIYNDCFDMLKVSKYNFEKYTNIKSEKVCKLLLMDSNNIIGFSLFEKNAIIFLAVSKQFRNKGYGSLLLTETENEIKQKHNQVKLVKNYNYFLCGIPDDPKSSYFPWFSKRGYKLDWQPVDLIIDLNKQKEFQIKNTEIFFRYRKNSLLERISCKYQVRKINKVWGRYFFKKDCKCLIALQNKKIIGGIILGNQCVYDESLRNTGFIKAVWVAKKYRKKGVGESLCAFAFNILKKENLNYCHIGYTHLAKWYENMGAQKYIEFSLATKYS